MHKKNSKWHKGIWNQLKKRWRVVQVVHMVCRKKPLEWMPMPRKDRSHRPVEKKNASNHGTRRGRARLHLMMKQLRSPPWVLQKLILKKSKKPKDA